MYKFTNLINKKLTIGNKPQQNWVFHAELIKCKLHVESIDASSEVVQPLIFDR